MNQFHVLGRKVQTFAVTIKRCENWPALTAAKLGLANDVNEVRLRDGCRLRVMTPLKATWGEIFEPAIADLYGIVRRGADVIVDIGANVGAFACHAAFLHRDALIHAFEPSKAHAAILRENISLNSLTNVIVHEAPVTRDGREVTFSKLGAGGSSSIFLHSGRDSFENLASVSPEVIDFGNAESVFFKLDCEGAEGELIEWICENVDRLPRKVSVACEYHPWCPVPITQSVERLRQHGFQAEESTLFDESYLFGSRGS